MTMKFGFAGFGVFGVAALLVVAAYGESFSSEDAGTRGVPISPVIDVSNPIAPSTTLAPEATTPETTFRPRVSRPPTTVSSTMNDLRMVAASPSTTTVPPSTTYQLPSASPPAATSQGNDVDAPVLVSLLVSPDPVVAGNSITFLWTLTDVSGVTFTTAFVQNPNGGWLSGCGGGSTALVNGTSTDGVYEQTCVIPSSASNGTWTITIHAEDPNGNTASAVAATSFIVTGGSNDVDAPVSVLSAIPSVTPAPTTTPKPSALPTPTPTIDAAMLKITEISSSYVSTSEIKTEILYAEEIVLNGVGLSASSRRLTSGTEVLSKLVEEYQLKQVEIMAQTYAQRSMIDFLRKTNGDLRVKVDSLEAKVDAHLAFIPELKTRV